ncbi:hypothetical protein ACNKHK_21940 [Shigella flexneri]
MDRSPLKQGEPLADLLWNEPSHPGQKPLQYLNADNGVADTKRALDGTRYILMERFAKMPRCWRKCVTICEDAYLVSTVVSGKKRKARNSATTWITTNRSLQCDPPCAGHVPWP